jgi:hypothetical protein
MDDTQEIKELLREIRDLQKAHLEYYKEFTQTIAARQKVSTEETERARAEQRRHREEMRQAVHDGQARVRTLVATRWVILAIAGVTAVLAIGGVAASYALALLLK